MQFKVNRKLGFVGRCPHVAQCVLKWVRSKRLIAVGPPCSDRDLVRYMHKTADAQRGASKQGPPEGFCLGYFPSAIGAVSIIGFLTV